MIGFNPGVFDARHICEIGEVASRRELCDKVRKIRAVVYKHGRARFVAAGESSRHRAKEFVADQTPRHRITRLQRRDQRNEDIIAIYREATRIGRVFSPRRLRRWPAPWISQRACEGVDR
jgi:hypothetical protein